MDFYKYQRLESSKKGLKSRQVFIWALLLFTALIIAAVAFYAVAVLLGQQAGPLAEQQRTQTNFVNPVRTVQQFQTEETVAPKEQTNIHFLYGTFASDIKKYRIYRADYDTRAVREVFSFSWTKADKSPAIAPYGENVAVYLDVNNGFLIDRMGKITNRLKFFPPYADFSVSDDGRKIYYFKYLSSTGAKSLVLRDIAKNDDIRIWTSGSDAARDCAFLGWDKNNANAYCIYKDGRRQTLRSFNSVGLSYNDINFADGALDVKFYPKLGYFVKTFASSISVYDVSSRKNIATIQAKEGEEFSHSFISEDGKIAYKTKETIDGVLQENIHTANIDGSGDIKILENAKRIVSISPDSKKILFERADETDVKLSHYIISNLDGSGQEELFSGGAIQFIEWFLE